MKKELSCLKRNKIFWNYHEIEVRISLGRANIPVYVTEGQQDVQPDNRLKTLLNQFIL